MSTKKQSYPQANVLSSTCHFLVIHLSFTCHPDTNSVLTPPIDERVLTKNDKSMTQNDKKINKLVMLNSQVKPQKNLLMTTMTTFSQKIQINKKVYKKREKRIIIKGYRNSCHSCHSSQNPHSWEATK